MTVCCVDTCGLTTDDDVLLFEFPISRLLRRRWLDAINPAATLGDDARVCIKHFNCTDYEHVRGETRLKGRVVPSVFGDQINENEDDKSDESESDEHSDIDNENRKSDSGKESDYESKNKKKKTRKSLKKRKGSQKSEKDNTNSQKNKTETDNLEENSKDSHNHNEKPDTKNEKTNNHNGKSDIEIEIPGINIEIPGIDIEIPGIDIGIPDIDIEIPDKDNVILDKNNVTLDNEKGNNEDSINEKGNKRRNSSEKVEKARKRAALPNGHRSLSSSDSCTSSQRNGKSPPPVAHDIEDLLTNYQIENKKTERQIAAMAEEFFAMQAENAPVFIEMEVGQGHQEPPSNDCLMLLENVQVDVDPSLLLADEDILEQIDLDDGDDDDLVEVEPETGTPQDTAKKQDPISLLTSSDEDEVIIEEPHIDTVEVSDETDEDDMPLVKLKPKAEKKSAKKLKKNKKRQPIEKIMWGASDYYCYQCRFTTVSRAEYKKHLETHSKVLQICQDCQFTTCSKSQLYRHRRKHKNEKKHKCPQCNYRSKHNMALIYHLRVHENGEKEVYSCDNCDFVTPIKSVFNTHRQSCVFNKTGRYPCVLCDYRSKRRSDLTRHMKTVHKDVESTDDEILG